MSIHRMPAARRLRGVRLATTGRLGRGQSLVEFALVAPVMLLLLLIVVDFGRLFMSYIALNNVTRVAANYGSLNPDQFTGTPNTATYDAVVGRETASLACALQAAGGHNPPIPTYPSGTQLGAPSVAAMTCQFTLLTPLISGFFGGTLPMAAEARFPVRTGAIANIGGGTTLPPPGGPVAAFSFTGVSNGSVDGSGNVSGMSPVTVNVVDGSSNAQTWDWNWGDGSAHEFVATPPAHTFTGSGPFTVTLLVTNTVGSSSAGHTVTLNAPTATPTVVDFYGTPQGTSPAVDGGGASGVAIKAVRGTSVAFTNLSTGANAYSWDFGDGSAPATGTSPSHAYGALGVYTVILTVTDPTGVSPKTRSSYVTIGCLAPNFASTLTNAAFGTYSGAGFTGSVRYKQNGANGNGSQNPPNPAKVIVSQENLQGGQLYNPTKNGNNPYGCNYDVTLVYTP